MVSLSPSLRVCASDEAGARGPPRQRVGEQGGTRAELPGGKSRKRAAGRVSSAVVRPSSHSRFRIQMNSQ